MSLRQIELVWVRVWVEWECFWVNLKEDNKVSESKMTVSESNMTEFKMAAIIKLSKNEWVKFFCANGGNQSWHVWVTIERKYYHCWIQYGQILDGRIQNGCHHQVESEWMSEMFCAKGGKKSWQVRVSLKEKTKMAESKMAKFKMAEFKMATIIKLSENEWVWVRLN